MYCNLHGASLQTNKHLLTVLSMFWFYDNTHHYIMYVCMTIMILHVLNHNHTNLCTHCLELVCMTACITMVVCMYVCMYACMYVRVILLLSSFTTKNKHLLTVLSIFCTRSFLRPVEIWYVVYGRGNLCGSTHKRIIMH
jgi:hypothetical protein